MGQIHPFPGDAYVFIVADDKSVSDALALLLRLEGFATQGFSDGLAFLDAVRLKSPACVILDLQLPGYSGLDVLRDLREMRFGPPVLGMSGHSDIATSVTAMKRGALDFMEKPFAASVMAAIDAHVAGLDFADALHLCSSHHCRALVTFDDKRFARRAQRLGLQPEVQIAG